MRKYFFRLFVMVCILFFIPLFSQSGILEPGVSGIGLRGGFASNENTTTFAGAFGYSVKGYLDIGFAVGRSTLNNNPFGEDLSSIGISPFMSLVFLKQGNNNMPFSMSVDAAYERDYIQSDILDDANIGLNADAFSFGSSLFGNIVSTGDNLIIQPLFSFSYNIVKLTATDKSTNESVSESDNLIAFGFALTLGVRNQTSTLFFVTPGITIVEGNTTFGANVGFVFPSSNKSRYRNKQSIQNGRSYSSEIDKLFDDRESEYLKIEKVNNNYFLVRKSPRHRMQLGEEYSIVRNRRGSKWEIIGVGRIVKIQGNKVAFEAQMFSQFDSVTTNDNLEYK